MKNFEVIKEVTDSDHFPVKLSLSRYDCEEIEQPEEKGDMSNKKKWNFNNSNKVEKFVSNLSISDNNNILINIPNVQEMYNNLIYVIFEAKVSSGIVMNKNLSRKSKCTLV